MERLKAQIEDLNRQLKEANDTIDAVRNGEIDALVIKGSHGNEVFTLKSADHLYRVILEKMAEGAVTLNERGIIQYSNSSFALMVNLTPALVVAELFEELVREEDRTHFAQMLESGWHRDIKGEINLITNTGFIPVQLSFTALRLGKDYTLSILITDLTEQKKAQVELNLRNDLLAKSNLALETSNNDLQQFASVASHDLQEPLRKILIYSHSLRDHFDQPDSEASKTYLDKLVGSATRMKALITDILDYSSLSNNEVELEKTDLNALLGELLVDLEMTIEEKQAIIQVEVMPPVLIVRSQMRQVFQNLISNALKFTAPGIRPNIRIWSTNGNSDGASGKLCHIHVKDNGIGFEEIYSKSVFNLFERLHGNMYGGTGIGLAICKRIIENHHGSITVQAEPGKGADFTITLPALVELTSATAG